MQEPELNPSKSENRICDRDVYLLMVIIALALSLNAEGLLMFVERHFGASSLRAVGYAAVFTGGGWVGLFSKRIAARITAWRDR